MCFKGMKLLKLDKKNCSYVLGIPPPTALEREYPSEFVLLWVLSLSSRVPYRFFLYLIMALGPF